MSLAIAIITAPRVRPTFDRTVVELRHGGFAGRLQAFAEPGSSVGEHAGVKVHQNAARLGMWRNWIQAARWLLLETTADRLMICEDDLELATGAAESLDEAFRTLSLEDWGCASLYTPPHYSARQTLVAGWQALDRNSVAVGALAWTFTRSSLRDLLHCKTVLLHAAPTGTDWVISDALQSLARRVYFHYPSLCAHTGDLNSTVGHTHVGVAALGFDRHFRRRFVA